MLKFTQSRFSRLFLLSAMATGASEAAPPSSQAEVSVAAVAREPIANVPDDDRSALLMIEFVNEWLAPEGKLRRLIEDEHQFSQSQEAARLALAAARQAGMPVIHATLQMSSDYRELGRARFGLRGAIQKAGTWQKQESGWQFHGPFAPLENEFVVSGRAGASAFSASDLDNYLRGQGITRLYLAGYATHVCIESTLRAAHDLGYEPVVLSDATAAFTDQQQQHVLNEVVHHFGWAMPTRIFVDSMSSTSKITNIPEASPAAPPAEPAETMRTLTAPGQDIPGISGAVVVKGDLALLSGHVPVAADGSVAPTLEDQLEQAFQNLDSTLHHAGSSLDQIARMTLYVRDYRPEQLGTIRTVRDRWLKGHAPASALIGVASLFRPEVLVEIDAIAVMR